MDVEKAYQQIKSSIPNDVTLVAVSKTKPTEQLLEAYNAGVRIFGENRVQEVVDKHEALPKDIEWHMIGHLQSKKTKYIAPFISLIHSVDSIKLLKVINKEAEKNNRVIDCLIQFHIAEEESKYGFLPNDAIELAEKINELNLKHVHIKGIMGMATFTDNTNQVQEEFRNLKQVFDLLKKNKWPHIDTLSMGMSGDYDIAIKEGSTMIRVGSKIFGSRK